MASVFKWLKPYSEDMGGSRLGVVIQYHVICISSLNCDIVPSYLDPLDSLLCQASGLRCLDLPVTFKQKVHQEADVPQFILWCQNWLHKNTVQDFRREKIMKTFCVALLSVLLMPSLAVSQECLFYEDFMQRSGSVFIATLACRGIDARGDIAYVANGDTDIEIVDISDPSQPVCISSVEVPGSPRDIAFYDDFPKVCQSVL